MLKAFKKTLYFPVASYFRFFAGIYLRKWNPKVIVVTGSQGKTTLLHLLEAQLGDRAIYSHGANSAFGVPFHILGMGRTTLSAIEWPLLFILAPFKAFRKSRAEKIYVVEADCDRPNDGKFLAALLRPSITLWVSVSRTHSMNFSQHAKKTIEEVTADEFANFARKTKDLVIGNGDSIEISDILGSLSVRHILLQQSEYLSNFSVGEHSTEFIIGGKMYTAPHLLPKDAACSILMTEMVASELGIPMDLSFSKLALPPGRSSIFEGTNDRILIDSSYNASLESMRSMLELFALYPKKPKWVVLGDMLELGDFEKEEHSRLADYVKKLDPECVILVGPRLRKSTFPLLSGIKAVVASFDGPAEALEYIETKSKGGEAILFKGARFLEGIIDQLLYNKNDSVKLPRRGKVWQERRKKWNI